MNAYAVVSHEFPLVTGMAIVVFALAFYTTAIITQAMKPVAVASKATPAVRKPRNKAMGR